MKVTKCFWKWPAIIRQQQAELEQLRRAQSKLVEWVKVTHRLDSPESEGIKALFQAGKRLIPILALLLMTTLSFGQAPPIIRQPVTTNFWFGPNPTEGGVPTWNAAAFKWSNNVPGGAASPHVWTNDNGVLRPIDFPTNIMLRPNVPDNGIGTNFHFDTSVRRTNSHSKIFQIYNGGSNAVTIGPDGGIFIGRGNTALFPGVVLYGIYDTAIGETNQQEIFIQSKNSAVGIGYNGSADLIVDTNYGALILTALKEDGVKFSRFAISAGAGINPENFNTFSMQALVDNATYFQVDPNFTLLTPTNYLFSSSVRITNIHTLMSLQNSNFPVFEVDGVGDLKLLKKVPYSWPSAQGAAGTALTNNGAGVLGWWPVLAAGGGGGDTVWTNDTSSPAITLVPALKTNTIYLTGRTIMSATQPVTQATLLITNITGQTNGFALIDQSNRSFFTGPYDFGWGFYVNPGDVQPPGADWVEWYVPRLGFSIRANYTNTDIHPYFLVRNRLDTLDLSMRMPVDTFTDGWGEIVAGNRGGVAPTNNLGIKFFGHTTTGEVYVARFDGHTKQWHMEGSVNVYGLHNSESDYQRIVLACDTTAAKLYSENSTAGSIPLSLGTVGTIRWNIGTAGHLTANTDSLYDIGAIGATRPRSAYLSSNFLVGTSFSVSNSFVGIGVTTPQKDLVINNPTGASVFVKLTTTSTGSGLTDGLEISDQFADAFIIKYENAPIHFYTANQRRMMIPGPGEMILWKSLHITNFPGDQDAKLFLWETNGRGYTSFSTTNSVISTNNLVWSIGSNTVSAAQVLKVHSTAISAGINTIVITNDADSGGGSVAFSDLVWTNDVGKIYPRVDQDRIAFYTNIILGRLIRADGTNTALGSNAAMPGFGGEKNTAVGTDALSIAGGTENSAFGHRAAISNSSGSFNVAIGSLAMEANEFRSDNTAVGYTSLRQFITGGQNTAIGSGTMDLLASSTDGTALGWGALDKMEGSGNTALGSQAMLNAEGGGNYNVAVGYEAFEGSDRLEANVVLGRGAMAGATDLTNIIAIGYQANSSSIGITNAVAIGANTRLITNNQMVFGTNITLYTFRNVMYGFPTAQGANSTALTNDGSGNLGWWPISVGGGNVNFSDLVWTNDSSIPGVRLATAIQTNRVQVTNLVSIGSGMRVNIGDSTSAGFSGMGLKSTVAAPSISADGGLFADTGGNVLFNYPASGNFFITGSGDHKVSVGRGGTDGFVGIGTGVETVAARFSVGTGSRFQVDSTGTVRSSSIIITNLPGATPGPFLRIAQTNGRGYAEFTTTNSVIATNRFVWSFGSNTVSAGQVAKVHSTSISGGINDIVITNDTDQTGGGSSFITNADYRTVVVSNSTAYGRAPRLPKDSFFFDSFDYPTRRGNTEWDGQIAYGTVTYTARQAGGGDHPGMNTNGYLVVTNNGSGSARALYLAVTNISTNEIGGFEKPKYITRLRSEFIPADYLNQGGGGDSASQVVLAHVTSINANPDAWIATGGGGANTRGTNVLHCVFAPAAKTLDIGYFTNGLSGAVLIAQTNLSGYFSYNQPTVWETLIFTNKLVNIINGHVIDTPYTITGAPGGHLATNYVATFELLTSDRTTNEAYNILLDNISAGWVDQDVKISEVYDAGVTNSTAISMKGPAPNTKIKTVSAGFNTTLTDNGGTNLTISSSASVGVYRTIYVDAAGMVPGATLGAQFDTSEQFSPTNRMTDSYLFSDSVSNIVQFKLAFPMEWDLSTIKYKIFYSSTNASATATNVWQVEATAISHDDPMDANWGTGITITNKITAANDLLLTGASAPLTVGGTPVAQDLVWFRIKRMGAAADDADTGQSKLLGIWLQYKEATNSVAIW